MQPEIDAYCVAANSLRLIESQTPVCTENLIRIDDVMESPKLAE
jgi:hypothetical protein